ncbi:Palmitoyltransferase ZDHHC3 [Schistosoma japonicum]|nr:Palmitoyltransferase ZDHHC3 [Schistosoma japonicum]
MQAHTVVLVAISCLFGLFILAILSDQYKSIVEDTTAIEAWQLRAVPSHSLDTEACPGDGGFGRKLSKLTLFREVFGSGPFYSWLLPCAYLFKPYPKYYTNLSNIIHDVNCSVNTPQVNHSLDNKTTVPLSSVVSPTLETDSSSDSSVSHY